MASLVAEQLTAKAAAMARPPVAAAARAIVVFIFLASPLVDSAACDASVGAKLSKSCEQIYRSLTLRYRQSVRREDKPGAYVAGDTHARGTRLVVQLLRDVGLVGR